MPQSPPGQPNFAGNPVNIFTFDVGLFSYDLDITLLLAEKLFAYSHSSCFFVSIRG